MKEKIAEIVKSANLELENVSDLKELTDLKVKYLGKKCELTALLKGLGALSPEERPIAGAMVNEARNDIEEKINNTEKVLKEKAMAQKLEAEKIDITAPSSKIIRGSKHPINRVIEEIQDIFVSMGYDVIDGPELETDEFCFERLNLPQGHPARDMQDSFYITEENL